MIVITVLLATYLWLRYSLPESPIHLHAINLCLGNDVDAQEHHVVGHPFIQEVHFTFFLV